MYTELGKLSVTSPFASHYKKGGRHGSVKRVWSNCRFKKGGIKKMPRGEKEKNSFTSTRGGGERECTFHCR